MASINRSELLKFRRSHAIIIGIDDYHRSVGTLATPVADAQRFKTILEKEQGFKEEDIRFLKDPTKVEIENLLASLTASGNVEEDGTEEFDISKKDCLIFYYAGHGLAGDLPEEGEEKGPAGYLLPKDAALQTAKLSDNTTLIKMEDVFDALNRVNAHHTLLILDCCFAGTFRRVNQTRGQLGITNRPMTETRFQRYKQKRAWQVLASAGPAEKAADWISERGDSSADREGKGKFRARHSPFAMALFEALGGLGNVDVKPKGKSLGDGVITSGELFLFLHDRVEKITRKDKDFKPQNPSLFPLGKDDGGQFIFVDPRHPKNAPDWATLKRSNPYKGLNQFDIIDSPFYYGREKDVDKVLAAMKWEEEEKGPPILMITGASGSGKSSFVKAGILSRYWEKEIETGDQKQKEYQLFQLRPGAKPWTIKKYEEDEWKDSYAVSEHLFNLPQAISPSLIGANSPLDPTQKQILLIDQYEELFTACTVAERTALEEALLDLLLKAMKPEGQLKLFITIRSDFEWQLEISALGQFYWPERNVYYHLCRLNSLGLDELRDVLINPAMVLAYDFEEQEQTNLVDIILDDLDYLPSALPLLSYTMQLLAEKTSKLKRVFLIDTYQKKIGGVAGAMQNRLQEIYGEFSSAEQLLMKQLILRMVNLSDGAYTRRRLFRFPKLDELQFVNDPNGDAIARLLEKLVEAQLILTDEVADIPFVELVHDSLINTGSTCKLWIQEFGRENLLLQRQLWEAVNEYHSNEEAVTFLWDKNPKISQLRAIVDSETSWLNVKELNFVEKSWQRRLDEIVRIKKQRDEAWATALAARGQQYSFQDVTHGLRIAEGAYEWTPTPLLPAVQSLVRTYYQAKDKGLYRFLLSRHKDQIWSMAISKDRNTVATGGQDGKIRLWNTANGQMLQEINNDESDFDGLPAPIRTLAISSDSENKAEYVITGNDRGTVRTWRVADGVMHHKKRFGSFFSSTWAVNISLNQAYMAVGGTNGVAMVWKPDDNQWPRKLVEGYSSTTLIYGLTFTTDNQHVLVLASDGMLKKIQLEPWEEVWNIELKIGLNAAAFSANRKYLLTGGLKQEVQLWDLEIMVAAPASDHQPVQTYTGHDGTINTLSFTEDQQTILSGSSDQTAILWDRSSGRLIQRFEVPNSSVQAAIIAADASFVVTGSHDGFGRIWNVNKDATLYLGHQIPIEGLSISSDGQFLLTFGHLYNGRENVMRREIKIWDQELGSELHAFSDKQMGQFFHHSNHYLTIQTDGLVEEWDEQHQIARSFQANAAISMTISHDDNWLLIGTERGDAILYDISLGQRAQEPFSRSSSRVNTVAFSPDDRFFVAGASDNIGASLWNIEDRTFTPLAGHSHRVMVAEFSRDGRILITGSWDTTVRVWDAITGNHIKTFDIGKLVSDLAISADGKYLITSSWDNSIVLRSIDTGEIIGDYPGHTDFVNGIVFGPDDLSFFSAGRDKTLRSWLTPEGIHEKLKTMSFYALSEAEKDRYGLNEKFE